MGQFNVGHVWMLEVDLYQDLELAPAHFLNLEGRFEDFWVETYLPLIGFWNELCNLKTTFLMR